MLFKSLRHVITFPVLFNNYDPVYLVKIASSKLSNHLRNRKSYRNLALERYIWVGFWYGVCHMQRTCLLCIIFFIHQSTKIICWKLYPLCCYKRILGHIQLDTPVKNISGKCIFLVSTQKLAHTEKYITCASTVTHKLCFLCIY